MPKNILIYMHNKIMYIENGRALVTCRLFLKLQAFVLIFEECVYPGSYNRIRMNLRLVILTL